MNYSIDRSLVVRMTELMQSLNIWKRSEMLDHLSSYVRDNFPEVTPQNRSFYPLPHVVSACMNRIKLANRFDAIDEVNLMSQVSRRI